MKKCLFALAALSVGAASQAAFFVAGEFNGWDPGNAGYEMTWDGSQYVKTVTGLNAGQGYEFKVTPGNWGNSWAGSNVKAIADASGSLKVTFHDLLGANWGDGYSPDAASRVGYNNGNAHDWEIIGAFNGWSGGILTLTHMGNGLYKGTTNIGAGNYDFKIRKAGDWGISVGADFGNSAGNLNIDLASASDVHFILDTEGGRIKATAVPEPATMAALGLGVAALLRRRKK